VRIAIIGLGHVGRSVRTTFGGFAETVEYDIATHDTYPEEDLARCDFGVVCVGTPMRPDGSCDTDPVRDAVRRLPLDRVLIKSTVAPGTTDRLIAETGKTICFSPEYIGESTYYSPFHAAGPRATPFVIVGGAPEPRRAFIDDLCPVLGPEKTYFQCSAVEAELVKYMENAYLATKVTFVNEFYEICRAFQADWHSVREGWLLDPRVERSHSSVFPEARGFSGRCLPKDVHAIVAASGGAGYEAHFLLAVLESNRRFGGDS
jgi:nucleotide sugar dehydrogenase